MDEPTVPAPGGMEVGANTGSVRPAGSAAAAASHLHSGGAAGSASTGKQPMSLGGAAQAQPGAAASSSSAGVRSPPPASRPQAPTPARAASSWPEASIEMLISLGFDRERAIAALDATGGNTDYAASMLFQ